MHTWYYRLNALLTFATTVLAVMCAVASFTEVMHESQPLIEEPIVNIDGLMVRGLIPHYGTFSVACWWSVAGILTLEPVQPERRNDRAWLSLDLDADLRSVFNWNTKQVLKAKLWMLSFLRCIGG